MYNLFNTEKTLIALVVLGLVILVRWLLLVPNRVAVILNDEANQLAMRLSRKRESYLRLPVVYKTEEEIKKLPTYNAICARFCVFNTWFRFSPDPDFPNYIFIAQVVDGCDALSSQAGGCAMSLPVHRGTGVRFTNRYRVRITI